MHVIGKTLTDFKNDRIIHLENKSSFIPGNGYTNLHLRSNFLSFEKSPKFKTKVSVVSSTVFHLFKPNTDKSDWEGWE